MCCACIHCYFSLYRLALAALHFQNASRKQAVTAKGEERYDILYPKYKKGHIIRKVTVNPTYLEYIVLSVWVFYNKLLFLLIEYVDDLLKETSGRCKERVIETPPSNTAAPLSSQFERPDKPIAIKSHKSRFA